VAVTDFFSQEKPSPLKCFKLEDFPKIAFSLCNLCDQLQKWSYLKTLIERLKFDPDLFLEYTDYSNFKHVYGFFGRAKKL